MIHLADRQNVLPEQHRSMQMEEGGRSVVQTSALRVQFTVIATRQAGVA